MGGAEMFTAVNLGTSGSSRNLANIEILVNNLGDSTLQQNLEDLEEADLKLFQMIIDFYCRLGELDLSTAPGYSFDDQLPFVDYLVMLDINVGYRLDELVTTLKKIRDRLPLFAHHQLVCEGALRLRYPNYAEILGFKPF
jgi:hypothetical protein